MKTEAKNTYKLPTGEPIRRALKTAFRAQRKQILASLTGKKAAGDLPDELPEFRLGNLAMSERMAPLIEAYWDKAGTQLLSRVGVDPDAWDVRNPEVEAAIDKAALDFSASTNQTTSLALDQALAKTRAELTAGVFTKGEALPILTKRINAIFDAAETWRARRIAASEASRALHAGQESAARKSGVVLGFEWLLSEDACPLCQTVGRRAKQVRLGQPFAIVGDHPVYSEIRHPPLHPSCQCSMKELVDQSDLPPELRDPEPQWAATLNQPVPEEQDKPAKPEPKPKKPRKPKPVKLTVVVIDPGPGATIGEVIPAKPAEPPKPLTIAERIAAYADGDAKVAALKARVLDRSDFVAKLNADATAYNANPKADTTGDIRRGLLARKEQIKTLGETNRAAVMDVLKTKNPGTFAGEPNPKKIPELERGRIAGAREWLGSITEMKPGTKVEVSYKGVAGRPYYQASTKILAVHTQISEAVVAHELGHAIEHQIPGVSKVCQEFFEYRRQGEAFKAMGKGYGKDEVGFDDQFGKAFGTGARYVGKKYANGTELLSMGLELLNQNPAKLVRDDPEYAKFLFGILDGSLRDDS